MPKKQTENDTSNSDTPKRNLLLEARGAATKQLIAAHKEEFDSLYVKEAADRGVTYTPEPTPEQVREQKLRALLAEDPTLAQRILAEQGVADSTDL